MWNIEKNFFQKNDDAKVIKIPFKFLSPDKYGPEKAGSFYQFDFAHVSLLSKKIHIFKIYFSNFFQKISKLFLK